MAMNMATSTSSISSAVAAKLRLEIKQKLLELTGEHEEELPDYVMVMIANQRSKYQMQDELNLFLADQTQEFVDWLHNKALKNLNGEDAKTAKKDNKRRDRKDSSSKPLNEQDIKPQPKSAPEEKNPLPPSIQGPKEPQAEKIEARHERSPSPPSPVIIINNKRDEPQERREYVPLPSTIGKFVVRDNNQYDDDEGVTNGKSVNSVIKVKERIYAPQDKQASKRLFSAQTSFLQDFKPSKTEISAMNETIEDITDENEDLRNLLKRKRKRDWNRVESERFADNYGDQEEVDKKKTRFIVTLDGAIERNLNFADDEDADVDGSEMDQTDELPSAATCRYFPNCKNSSCLFYHPAEGESTNGSICKWFPKCEYKHACKFKHPDCKYSSGCTNPNCQFKHPSGWRPPSSRPVARPARQAFVDTTKFKWTKNESSA